MPPLQAVLVERKPRTFRSGAFWVLCFVMREVNMAMVKSDQPFAGISEMMTQNFEQTRKAMEKYVDLFGTGMKDSPWLDGDINRKMQSYIEKNMAAANEFIQKLSEAKDVQSFWQVQTDFMQTQWKMLNETMKDLSSEAKRSVTGAFKNIAT